MEKHKGHNDDCPPRKLLVILDGPFGIMLRDVPGHQCAEGADHCPDCPDILAFAAEVHGHEYKINRSDWEEGSYYLTGATNSMYRYVSDYGLSGGKTFEIDMRNINLHPDVAPHVALSLPFPNNIYPHRLMDFAFRDAGSPGPHYASIPGALVLEYDSAVNPVIEPGCITPCSGKHYDYFYLFVGPSDAMSQHDKSDEGISHARNAWSQFTRHFKGLTCEMFAAAICGCGGNASVKDPAGISDALIAKIHKNPCNPDGPVGQGVSGANCKHPQVIGSYATKENTYFSGKG